MPSTIQKVCWRLWDDIDPASQRKKNKTKTHHSISSGIENELKWILECKICEKKELFLTAKLWRLELCHA